METNAEQTREIPVCNVDKRVPNQTYISPWRDKEECQTVYELIFNSPPDAIEPKEHALRWLKMWRIRLMKDFPILVRCTFQILEAQVSDLRSQRQAGGTTSEIEIKHIYGGAFTRFINLITERFGGFAKKPIAELVREIGIETYLVELRHLCAHSSVAISLDVFRRSANYCMDWLKVAYWQREMAGMQPVTLATIQQPAHVPADQLQQLTELLQMYDALTAARLRKQKDVIMLATNQLLRAHSKKYRVKHFHAIRDHLVLMLQELKLPGTVAAANVVCKAVFDNCTQLFDDALEYGEGKQEPVGRIHSPFFQALAAMGCVQTFFKQLMEICEQPGPTDGAADRRPAAKYWAYRIAFAFQLVKEYKLLCRTKPARSLPWYGDAQTASRASKWFANRTKSAPGQHINLGLSVNCPWRLKVSREYALARLATMNDYTREIVPILLFLAEPQLAPSKQQKIVQISQAFHVDKLSVVAAKKFMPGDLRIYTADDLLKRIGQKRTHSKAREDEVPERKKLKRCGVWTEADVEVDWSRYPLGKCPPSK